MSKISDPTLSASLYSCDDIFSNTTPAHKDFCNIESPTNKQDVEIGAKLQRLQSRKYGTKRKKRADHQTTTSKKIITSTKSTLNYVSHMNHSEERAMRKKTRNDKKITLAMEKIPKSRIKSTPMKKKLQTDNDYWQETKLKQDVTLETKTELTNEQRKESDSTVSAKKDRSESKERARHEKNRTRKRKKETVVSERNKQKKNVHIVGTEEELQSAKTNQLGVTSLRHNRNKSKDRLKTKPKAVEDVQNHNEEEWLNDVDNYGLDGSFCSLVQDINRLIPHWATDKVRSINAMYMQGIPIEEVNEFFSMQHKTPDIRAAFGKYYMKRARTSSAVWLN